MTEPLVLHLHGPLGERFGRVHRRYVSSPAEFIRALCRTHYGFREMLDRDDAPYHFYVGKQDIGAQDLAMHVSGQELHLVPAVAAAKSDTGQIILGAVIIAAAIYTGNYAAAAKGAELTAGQVVAGYASNVMFSVGASMVLGGIAQMLAPSPAAVKDKDNERETGSAIYSGPVNTVGQNHPIQILLGESEIGSAVLASMVTNTNVSVIGAKDGSRGIHVDTMVENRTFTPGGIGESGEYEPGVNYPPSQSRVAGAYVIGVGIDTAEKDALYEAAVSGTHNIASALELVTTAGRLIASDALPILLPDFSTKSMAELAPGNILLGGSSVVSLTRVVMQPLYTPVLTDLFYQEYDHHVTGEDKPVEPFVWPTRLVYWAGGVPVKPEISERR